MVLSSEVFLIFCMPVLMGHILWEVSQMLAFCQTCIYCWSYDVTYRQNSTKLA